MKPNNKTTDNSGNQPADDFYSDFRRKLEQAHSFPTQYMFKFIVPSEQSVIARLYAIFDDSAADISTRDSKNGKYISISTKVQVNDPDDVIIYYRQAAAIEGVVML